MLERGFKTAQKLIGNKDNVKQVAIQRAWEILKAAGVVDPRLEAASRVDLRQQAYDLLLQVRKPSPAEKKALLEKKGLVFLPVQEISLSQLIAENQDYFWSGDLEYINSKTQLRDYSLPAIEVALNPTELALPDSFDKSRSTQLAMIEGYSKKQVETEFPDAKAIMLPAVGYAQADKVYKETTGEVLFKTFFARVLDNTSGVGATGVGRVHPDGRLLVHVWRAGDGNGSVGAVPAVVFLRK